MSGDANARFDFLDGLYTDLHAVGSRVTCNPPPEDSDEDWLFLTNSMLQFLSAAEQNGFSVGGSLIEAATADAISPNGFVSLNRDSDKMNLIVVQSTEFRDRFIAATHVAKTLNLIHKSDRILLFQAVLYASCYNGKR